MEQQRSNAVTGLFKLRMVFCFARYASSNIRIRDQEARTLKKTQHSSQGDARFGQFLAATAAVTLSGVGLGLTLAGDAQAKPRSESQARKLNPANRPAARTSPIRVNGSATPGTGNEHAYKIVEEHTGMGVHTTKNAANSSKTTAASSGESQITAASPEK